MNIENFFKLNFLTVHLDMPFPPFFEEKEQNATKMTRQRCEIAIKIIVKYLLLLNRITFYLILKIIH